MNILKKLRDRENGASYDCTYDYALRRLCVAKEDSWRGISPSNYSSDYNPEPPIFSAKFANCDGYRHILAIANEDGKIALQDTRKRNYEMEEKALNAPQCHYNAVFDLEWAPGQMKFISASGDHTARLWEVKGSEIRNVRSFVGHTRSVKTAAFRRSDPTVFATGGRDGAIIIWDTRANLNVDLMPRADNCIYSGHVGGPGTPVSQKKRTRTPKLAANTTSSSITGLAFQDENTLISCGAGDGIIKVWDLRRNYTTYKKEPHPKHSLPYAGSSTFKGFTNLIIDKSGTQLFANCMDNTIYCYNLCSYAPKPIAQYKGLLNSTFYIKACLSPDGKYLLSGSSDEKAYIWNLKYPDEPLVSLQGHTVEVTCVAWGAVNDCPIVTCSDDARHKIWRIGPEHIPESESALYTGRAEYARRFTVNNVRRDNVASGSGLGKYNLRDLESTPRSLKRLVEQNERTPNSVEKQSLKRSYVEMLACGDNDNHADEQETKRPKSYEPKGRRLFGCSTSSRSSSAATTSTVQSSTGLSTIQEEQANSLLEGNSASNQENDILESSAFSVAMTVTANSKSTNCIPLSPLSERVISQNHRHTLPSIAFHEPTTSTSQSQQQQQQQLSSLIFSPTSNLPNFVLDGDAPHLSLMSPKRKHKDKVDWLTKIRKQKLMTSSRGGGGGISGISGGGLSGTTLSEKICEEHTHTDAIAGSSAPSPRLRNLRNAECSPRLSVTPRRRTSHTGHATHGAMSPSTAPASALAHPRTPTSSRRNSETTLLRFFSLQSHNNRTNNDANDASTHAELNDLHMPRQLSTTCTE